jgi:hypothetical protein
VQIFGESLANCSGKEEPEWIGAAVIAILGHRKFPVTGGVDELSTANSSSCQDASNKSRYLQTLKMHFPAAIAAYLNKAMQRSGENAFFEHKINPAAR